MPRYTYSFLGLVQQLTNWLLPLLASLKVICSHKVPVLFFFRTLPSLTPLTLHFFGARRLRFLLVLYGQLFGAWKPDELTFSPPVPGFQDLLERMPVPSWAVQVLCKGFIGFPGNQRNIGLSLPLFSTLSFPQDWPSPGQRPFAIRPPSIHHKFLPDPVAQVSSDGTLGRHRLSSFLGSWGTLRPKGPLGRYLGDAPPSFRVFLSLCPAKRLGDDLHHLSTHPNTDS